jgi:hypothetical protein
LVRELAASTQDARTLTVACAPADGGGARWPVAAIVEAITGLDAFAPPEAARTRLAELFAGQHDADRVVTQLLALLAIDGTAETDRVRWSLRRLMEVALVEMPTVLHIDDADRAGGGFLRLLADVTTAARDVPVLVALTTVRESDGLPAIRLGPLLPTETAALVRTVLGPTEPGVDAAVADRLPPSPFAIEQAVTLLIESGTLAPGQGAWRAMADLAQVPIPDTTVGLIRQRLQALPAQELVVLGMAAVAGETFEVAPLLEVVPDDARSGVAAALTDLIKRGYLVGGPEIYAFRHPSLREATMPGVPAWAQASAHERTGRALERRAGDRRSRSADAVGHHLEASWRLRSDAPPGDRADALGLLTSSATEAVAEGDLEGAARLERLAATLVHDDPVRRAELLYLAAEHGSRAAPERPADREVAEAALAASAAGDDVDWRVRLLRARLRTAAGHEDALEGARSTADEAIAALPDDEPSWALSSAWALRGMVHAARSQNGLVAEDLGVAADNAAAANRRAEETAALRDAAAALLDGPLPVADAEARCTSFLGRVQGPLADHDVRSAIAVLRARRGDFDEPRRSVAASIAELDELGAAADLAIALHRAAQIEVLAGQGNAAEPQMQRALAAATHARDDGLRARLAAAFAHVLVADDDRLEEALALADVAEAHAADMTTQVGWRMARARVMVRRGRSGQAERLVREGLGIAEQTDSTDLRANALLWAADVRRRAGRPSEAEPFERRALRLFERRGATAQAASAAAAFSPVAGDQLASGVGVTEAPPSAEDVRPDAPVTAGEPQEIAAPAPDQAPGAATRLADEMMAMLAGPEAPADPLPSAPTERPSAQIDADDELLDDPMHIAEEESHRRWFNR